MLSAGSVPHTILTLGSGFPDVFLIPQGYYGVMELSLSLSGAPNDAEVLRASLRMAAREGYEVRVILTRDFHRPGLLRMIDDALWDLAKLELYPPRVVVERKWARVEVPAPAPAAERELPHAATPRATALK